MSDKDPKHELTLPLFLHHNTVMLLEVYTRKDSLEEWARKLWLEENIPFRDLLSSSAEQMVRQLSPHACAAFWIELTKAIHAEVENTDQAHGSDHAKSLAPIPTKGTNPNASS